ncbi:MAG TPA: LptE family protein [Pirellulales bacterium]
MIFCWALALAAAGCGCYKVGNATLYPPDIRTVYVPMFDSTSFRPWLGERLTEAVCKEIELKTPFKVVHDANADSVLTGRILNESKGALTMAQTGEARYLQYNMQVEVSWLDRKGGLVQQTNGIPIPSTLASISQQSQFAPETGQSVSTAQMQDIQRLAEQIVSLMEAPW